MLPKHDCPAWLRWGETLCGHKDNFPMELRAQPGLPWKHQESRMYKNPQKIFGMPIGKCKAERLYPNICFGNNVLSSSPKGGKVLICRTTSQENTLLQQIHTWDLKAPQALRKFKRIKRKQKHPVFCQNSQISSELPTSLQLPSSFSDGMIFPFPGLSRSSSDLCC